ncbi:aminotransferase class III, partial [Elstera litoralis]
LFLTHGQDGRVWDVDGNEYVDMISSLMPIVLGYRDADVDYAIRNQLTRGISFSLPTTLEQELARVLCDIIPSAEMVRFGKNGSDATSAAIRMARAYTGRDRVIVCGYHGWQDWYIGATARNKGVPSAVQNLTTMVPYNDLEAFDKVFTGHPGEIACVIMETANVTEPKPGFLQGVKDLAHKHGALLVFDEIITGFRFALGGAQSLFGVTPDLSCFGKAMANGMPLSAVVGRRDVMMEMEKIFYSGTFGGEALSLAASLATIDKLKREAVIPRLWSLGADLAEDVNALIEKHELGHVFGLVGFAPWKVLVVQDHANIRKEAIKTMFLTEMLARGVLLNASHNVCWTHNATDMARTRQAWDGALVAVKQGLTSGTLIEQLKAPIIEPIFKVR